MKIAIGCDHGGLHLKNELIKHLKDMGYRVKDFGTYTSKSCDYPDIAFCVAEEVSKNNFERGVLVCGTGLGMAIAANKVQGIKAVTCHEPYSAEMSVKHNNANIITFGERVIGLELAKLTLISWLKASFEGERHSKRVEKIDSYKSTMKETC